MAALIQAILRKIAPLKDYLILAALVGVVATGAWFIHHERQIGEQRWQRRLAEKELLWKANVDKVNEDAKVTIDGLQAKLDAKLATPPSDPLHVRVCKSAPTSPSSVPTGESPVPSGDGPSGPSSPVARDDQGVDIGPATEAILNELSAKIDYLQGYIRTCQKAGVCKTN